MKTIINAKFFLICFSILAANNILNSQPREINYSNWFFGNKAGLSFNTSDSIPVEIYSNIDTLTSMEGISTFSDDEGNVKLVCNGQRLVHFYDKDDLTKYKIFNFENIKRVTSSTNSTIILPSLSNPNQFHIFVVGEFETDKYSTEMYYGIFDIYLNNGLGDFTLNMKEINDKVSEKLAVVYDYNYNWYWIVTTSSDLFKIPNFLFYKLNETGLNEVPIEIKANSRYDLVGDMKFSMSGRQLVVCGGRSDYLDLYKFDFENCTIEKIFNFKIDSSNFNTSSIYSAEFSEDESKLYISYHKSENNKNVGYLDQLTISDIRVDISKTRNTLMKDTIAFGNIKRGIDNRLYITTIDFNAKNNTPNFYSAYNYLTVLDNTNESVNEITNSTFQFSDSRYSISGLQTSPTILNEPPKQDKCTPNLSVFLSDKIVQLGDTFCINGTFIPECADDSFLDKLNIYFEYDPFLMSFLSTSSSTYSIIQNKEKSILKLTFDSKDLLVNQANEFNFCFRSLLGNSKFPVINVLDNDESKISYSLIDSINSNIEYISCDQPFRQIKMVIVTDFEAILVNSNLSIKLATEEKGLFKFIIVDVNGQIVKQKDYNTSKSKYSYEEIFQIDLSDISSGVYNIRMTSPSGKYYTKRIILVD